MNISAHCSYSEGIRSQTAKRRGIKNEPNKEQLENMKKVANEVFEPIRERNGKPIYISSFFRSKALNKAIGGSTTSQHCEGKAMDIDADVYGGMTNKQIFLFILHNLDFDQLIWEFGTDDNPDWVHVSFNEGNNRKQVIRAVKEGRSVKYVPYVAK